MLVIDLEYNKFRTLIIRKGLQKFFIEDNQRIDVFAGDGIFVYRFSILKEDIDDLNLFNINILYDAIKAIKISEVFDFPETQSEVDDDFIDYPEPSERIEEANPYEYLHIPKVR